MYRKLHKKRSITYKHLIEQNSVSPVLWIRVPSHQYRSRILNMIFDNFVLKNRFNLLYVLINRSLKFVFNNFFSFPLTGSFCSTRFLSQNCPDSDLDLHTLVETVDYEDRGRGFTGPKPLCTQATYIRWYLRTMLRTHE